MKLSDAKKKGYFETELDISERYEEFKKGEFVLTFREPNEDEFMGLMATKKKEDESGMGMALAFMSLWPVLMTNWTIEDDAGEKSKKEDVVKLVKTMSGACMFISTELTKRLPLAKWRSTASDKSQDSSSVESQ